jgi:hypothetical protein
VIFVTQRVRALSAILLNLFEQNLAEQKMPFGRILMVAEKSSGYALGVSSKAFVEERSRFH